MKKIIFILALIIAISNTYAQSDNSKGKGKGNGDGSGNKEKGKGKSLSPEERADKITLRLKEKLSLTEEQTPKVKQITLTRVNAIKAAKDASKDDKKAFGQERKKLVQAWEVDLKGILTPEQFTKYTAYKEEQKKKVKEAKKNKKSVEEDVEDETAE